MSRSSGRTRRPLYYQLIASSGSWIAVSASALFLLMLASLFGPFEVCGLQARGFPPHVGLWLPPSTPADAIAPVRAAWRRSEPSGAEWSESASLDELAAAGVDVAVVPHARRLAAGERAALDRYVRGGGAAVVSGAIGVRDADGSWLGWEAMQGFLGVQRVTPLPREQTHFLSAGTRSALTAGVDPGQRFALAPEQGAPAIALPNAPLHWSGFALDPVSDAAAAMLAVERGAGRLVWLAVGPEYAADDASVRGLARLSSAALAWAGRLPVAEVAAWPDAAPFAALLAMDTEDRFENAASVAEISIRDELPITFLAVSNQALRHPALTAELARVGEVGSHGDDHGGFEGLPRAAQRERLERSRRDLEALGVPSPRGFRPPLLSYDAATLDAAAENHFQYVLCNHRFDRLVPTLAPHGNGAGPLVQIARVVRDDVDLIERDGLAEPDAIAAAALADARAVARRGGLYYFSFHSQLLAAPERIAALPAIGRGLRSEGAWLARGAELAHWWRSRAGLAVELRRAGPRRVALAVSNSGDRATEQAVVRVHLHEPLGAAALSAATAFQGVRERWLAAAPELRFEPGDVSIDLALPPISPGRRVAWNLDWSGATE